MSYFQTEIPRKRPDWANWLRSFQVGEERGVDAEDKASIKVAATREKHRGYAQFKFEGLTIKRIK